MADAAWGSTDSVCDVIVAVASFDRQGSSDKHHDPGFSLTLVMPCAMVLTVLAANRVSHGAYLVSLVSADGGRGPTAFRIVAPLALAAAVIQVTLGGVVRVTGSGLGCPDWPLCHGQLIPPMELETLIEYSHRLSAALLGVLVLATFALGWRAYTRWRPATVSSALALVLVVVAAILGGITVLTELAWWGIVVHLAIAEALVACLVVASAEGWIIGKGTDRGNHGSREPGGFRLLAAGALAGTFALILAGSYMVGRGYGSSCATWPLCREALLPEGEAYMVHMLHRYVAAAAGVVVAAMAGWAWSRRDSRPDLVWPSLVVAGLFVLQTLMGAVTVWTGFAPALRSLHLMVATVTWASLVLVAYRALSAGGPAAKLKEPSTEPVASLGGGKP